jgi:UDP-N-acetyl-D-mannosaminuronic acid dehydrogenase
VSIWFSIRKETKLKISIVGGGGRVGLPLGIVLSGAGHLVSIIDLDENRVSMINSRKMPFHEAGAEDLLKALNVNQLNASINNSRIEDSDICILIVGTPVLEDGTPSANSLVNLVSQLIPHLDNVKMLMLRSTVYPGITRKLKNLLIESGIETKISFCPERIAEGNAIQELKSLPQIVGAEDDSAIELSNRIFSSIGSKVILTSIEEAELIKLFANSYRYLQFGIANEFFEICKSNDINWVNVWDALTTEYPRAANLPKPGFAAGPCLVKDTKQLNYYYKNNFALGKSALDVNENLPDFLVRQLQKVYSLEELTIGILGMTFKGNVDDFRDSLSFKLLEILRKVAKNVICSDALLQKEYFVPEKQILEVSDVIIIATPHDQYRSIITEKPIIDIWRITRNKSLF